MSLPTSEYHAVRPADEPVETPYYGYGSSNQNYRNSIQAPNHGVGFVEPILQSDLYVTVDSAYFQSQIDNLQGQIDGCIQGIGPVDTVPNANAGIIDANQILHLEPADATFPGVISTTTQQIAGDKEFMDNVTVDKNIYLPFSTATEGVIYNDGYPLLYTSTGHAERATVFVGRETGNFTNTGNGNTGVGFQNCNQITTGSGNCCVGYKCGTALTTGLTNVLIGHSQGINMTNNYYNVCIGWDATVYSANEHQNLCILNKGTVGDNNKIRIGTYPNQNGVYIAGIWNQSTAGGGTTVYCDSNGKLGTVVSAQRFKNNINDITDAKVDKLHQLRVVDFYYNTDTQMEYIQNGLIAEEVNNVFPEMIIRDENNEIFSIAYHQIWPLLIKDSQKRKQEITALQSNQRLPISFSPNIVAADATFVLSAPIILPASKITSVSCLCSAVGVTGELRIVDIASSQIIASTSISASAGVVDMTIIQSLIAADCGIRAEVRVSAGSGSITVHNILIS